MSKHESLAAALAAFQAELPSIAKDNVAQVRSDKGNYSYKYADLSDITPVILPKLAEQGLSWVTRPTMENGAFILAYALMHESGNGSIEGIYPLPAPSIPAQQLGSAITYARRYVLCAVTGIAPGGDDDDAANAPAAPSAPPVQVPVWPKLIADAATVAELTALYNRANTERWASEEFVKMLTTRRQEIEAPRDETAVTDAARAAFESETAAP